MEDLAALVEANEEAAAAIAAAYQILIGGVPSIAGFTALINSANASNFGSGDPSIEFNQENIFINIFNSLVQGNPDAAAAFDTITAGASSLIDQIEALYNYLIPAGAQSEGGLAYLTRPEALAFYEQVALERGVAGPDGAAIVAMASLMNIAYSQDLPGIGDAVNDLIAAIEDGTAALPDAGTEFTPIEEADGTAHDADDNSASGTIALTDRIDAPGIDETLPGNGIDTTGTGFDDTYIANGATLNPGDVIDAGGGTDTLLLNFIDQGLTILDIGTGFIPGIGLTVNLPVFELESTGLEMLEVQLQGGNDILDNLLSPPLNPFEPIISGAEIDLSRAEGITDIDLDRSSGIMRFSSIQNNVNINLTDSVGWFQYIFDEDALGSATATATLNVDHVYAILDIETNGTDSFTDLVINTTDYNVLQISDNWDSNALPLTSLTVTGAGTNVLISGFTSFDLLEFTNTGNIVTNEFSGLTSIDFSANTGGTAIELLFNMEDLTFEGGTGNDIALLGSDSGGGYLTNDDSFDGGAGYDILGFGGDDLVGLDPATVQNFELFALFNDASGDPFEIEGDDFPVDIALIADWNATLTLDDFDDHTLYVLESQNSGTSVIAFDDTDVANLSIGLPIELQTYAALGLDFLDELGLDAFIPLLTNPTFPIVITIDEVDLSGTDTGNFELGGGILAGFPTFLELTLLTVDGSTSTIAVTGSGNMQIDDIAFTTAADEFDGLTFDLSASTGGFDNGGPGSDDLVGEQTYIIGALTGIDPTVGPALSTVYDVNEDGTFDDLQSIINFGLDPAYDPDADALPDNGDGTQDFAIFTQSDFGTVVVENFTPWNTAGIALNEQDILDFTALGVNELSDLDFTDIDTDNNAAVDSVAVTSDLFDGQVVLVGVLAIDLSNENFDFVV